MKILKPKFWSKINLISVLLLPFSLVTLIFIFIKKFIIKERGFQIPIICVGNIYLGGTGKTPLSIYIYNLLKNKNFNPALVRKYYKSHIDEINLTQSNLKNFFLNKSRISSIVQAENNGCKAIVMDDGLQDSSIQKDVKIVCFNSTDLIGNGFLLPAGPLRETLYGLKNAHLLVINGKKDLAFEKKIKKISENIKIFYSKYEMKKSNKLKKKKLLAFSGIGNPNGFFNLLKKNKLKVKKEISYPDHYNYKKSEILNLKKIAKKENLSLITTEKDYFRIKRLGFGKIAYIPISLKLFKEKKFKDELLNLL